MKKQQPLPRRAGVMLPVFSLPGPYGIGTLGSEAYRFIEFLKTSGQKIWQVLPCGPTGFGDSPYQSFSAFAGNPYFISPELLVRDGLLTDSEADTARRDPGDPINYGDLYQNRLNLLQQAANRFGFDSDADFGRFCAEEADWLNDFAFFMALKGRFEGRSWHDWPSDIRHREPKAMERFGKELYHPIRFWKFTQYCFFRQWSMLKKFAGEHDVQLLGDLPIYAADDSADVWANPGLFLLDSELRPEAVAGVPPDYFSADGQRWGNPLYRWDVMAQDHFSWWRQRMAANARLYDIIRIDHFLGLVRYWAVDAACDTARDGTFKKGPGRALLEALQEDPGCTVIAEDLGVANPDVNALLEEAGYPGMKVLLFAFDGDPKNPYLPHMHRPNSVCYIGTHDNETMAAFCQKPESREQAAHAMEYFGVDSADRLPGAMRRAAFYSTCSTVIISMADWLNLDDSARINRPGSSFGNWQWRLEDWQMTNELAVRMRRLTELAGRL